MRRLRNKIKRWFDRIWGEDIPLGASPSLTEALAIEFLIMDFREELDAWGTDASIA